MNPELLHESRTNTSRHVKQNPSSNVDKKRMGEDALTGDKMATEGDEHIADAVITNIVAADLLCITVAVGRGSAATTVGPSPAAAAARRAPPACASPLPTSCPRGDPPPPSVGFAVRRRVHQREKGGRGRRREGDGSGGSSPCSGSPLAQDDDATDGIFPTREEESFCSRASIVEAKGFGPGTNLRRGLNEHNFSGGPVFDPRPGPLWVRPCSGRGWGQPNKACTGKYSIPLLQERDEGAGADGLSALVETLRPKQEILAVGFERSFVRISASGQWTRPTESEMILVAACHNNQLPQRVLHFAWWKIRMFQ
jgi:hypothetical protein